MSIVLRDLVKRFGKATVVDRVSLEIAEGELFVLLGASGSGKSTILRMIAGLVPLDDGRILLGARDVTDAPPAGRNVGLVFQHYALFPHMTVAENVEFGLSVRKVPGPQRVARRDELLAIVGLAGFAGRNVRRLSGGQQQRVAVARALAHEPAVLLLDEPFGALDAKIRSRMRRSLRRIQRRVGVTTILVTHDQDEAFELGDRIGVLDRGRLLEVAEPETLYRTPRHEGVAAFLGEANLFGLQPDGADALRLGPLRVARPSGAAGGERWAVLLRPEDVELAWDGRELTSPYLGRGTIEEVLPSAGSRRIRVRIDPLDGAWPLDAEFGDAEPVLRVVVSAAADAEVTLSPGDEVQVGVRRTHVLPRVVPRLLLVACDAAVPALAGGLELARVFADGFGGELTILCVGEDESAGQRLTADVAEEAQRRVPAATLRSRVGSVPESTLDELSERPYDLVIVVAAGGSEAQDAAARELARCAPVSVLMARGDPRPVRRMLLCTAGGEPGKLDVVFGSRLGRATGAQATLLHVHEVSNAAPGTPGGQIAERLASLVRPPFHGRMGERPSGAGVASTRSGAPPAGGSHAPSAPPLRHAHDEDVREWIEGHLEHGARTLRARGVEAAVRIEPGPVVERVLEVASEEDHDLIVIGAHLPGTRPSRDQGDLAERLLARAERSVLVVRGTFGS